MVDERLEAPANMNSGESSSSDEPAFGAVEAAALAYVDGDRTPYGGLMARRELKFEALESQRLGADIRVRIGYQPTSRFSGRPGEEWVLVSPEGEILTRELLSRPKENQP